MTSAVAPQKPTPVRRKITIPSLMKKMKDGEAIVQMAVYDYRSAVVADRLGIDILCVSDTGGMVLFGHRSTVSVSFEEVMFMAQAVDRGSRYGLRMVDMPYWSFHVSPQQAVDNAGKFVAQANAEVMKCEGNRHHVPNIGAIIEAGIPVQGHIGITPMRMAQLGGFIAQGKTAERAIELVVDARETVPVVSLGAGNKAHGVHIISSDLFHLYEEHTPRHSKIYTDLIPIIEDVYTRYAADVRNRTYPGPEHTVYMTPSELERFASKVGWTSPPIKQAEERARAKRA